MSRNSKVLFAAFCIILLGLAVILLPSFNHFFVDRIFYLQSPDITVKHGPEKIILKEGDRGYAEIFRQAIEVISQPKDTLLLQVAGDFDSYAGNRSYVQLDVDYPLRGKRRYFALIDDYSPWEGEVYWCSLDALSGCEGYSAYITRDLEGFKSLGETFDKELGPHLNQPAKSNPASPASFALRLETKSMAQLGEPVPLKLTLKNIENSSITTYLTGRPDYGFTGAYDFIVTDANGSEVWRWTHDKVILTILSEVTLAPGEELMFKEGWEQIDNNGDPVGDGAYFVRGTLNFGDLPEDYRLETEPKKLVILSAEELPMLDLEGVGR